MTDCYALGCLVIVLSAIAFTLTGLAVFIVVEAWLKEGMPFRFPRDLMHRTNLVFLVALCFGACGFAGAALMAVDGYQEVGCADQAR